MGLFLPTNLVFVKELVAPIPVTCGRFLYIPVTVDFLLHTFQWQGSHAEGTFSPVTCFFYLSSAFKQSYELMKFGWIPRAAELEEKKKFNTCCWGSSRVLLGSLTCCLCGLQVRKTTNRLSDHMCYWNSNIEGIKLGGRGWIFLLLLLF